MEGPSIYLLANRLQVVAKQKIIKMAGNAHFEIDKEDLVGQTIQEIYAFGKRLVIQLDDYAIVSHFLMYGSYRIDEERKDKIPRLVLWTKKHKVYFYSCSSKCVTKKHIIERVPFEFDILSDQWNIKKVIAKVKRHPKATIDDILLDQEIFAGVGNIIKNEALFMSKIAPTHTIAKLSDKKLKEIALNTRSFSELFLQLISQEEWIKKHLQIYRKITCPICGTKVIRKKTGVRNRWSFYCPHCQK